MPTPPPPRPAPAFLVGDIVQLRTAYRTTRYVVQTLAPTGHRRRAVNLAEGDRFCVVCPCPAGLAFYRHHQDGPAWVVADGRGRFRVPERLLAKVKADLEGCA